MGLRLLTKPSFVVENNVPATIHIVADAGTEHGQILVKLTNRDSRKIALISLELGLLAAARLLAL